MPGVEQTYTVDFCSVRLYTELSNSIFRKVVYIQRKGQFSAFFFNGLSLFSFIAFSYELNGKILYAKVTKEFPIICIGKRNISMCRSRLLQAPVELNACGQLPVSPEYFL